MDYDHIIDLLKRRQAIDNELSQLFAGQQTKKEVHCSPCGHGSHPARQASPSEGTSNRPNSMISAGGARPVVSMLMTLSNNALAPVKCWPRRYERRATTRPPPACGRGQYCGAYHRNGRETTSILAGHDD